jgi:L-threonylcarbamoyladenylate synthase
MTQPNPDHLPVPANSANIERAAHFIQRSGLVAFPTETVYGLGANALDQDAVARIFEAKGRPRFDPLIVHVYNLSHAQSLVETMTDPGMKLARTFWPGPLTLVLPKQLHVPDIITAGLDSVAIRVPAHPTAIRLLHLAKVPIAAPSANRFGAVSPTTAQHVYDELAGRVDMILDAGPCMAGLESTVLSLVDPNNPVLLRPGALAVERIEAIIGPVKRQHDSPNRFSPGQSHTPQVAPGMLPSHYAPATPLLFVDHIPMDFPPTAKKVGLISLTPPEHPERFAAIQALSPEGDLNKAAPRLFSALRELDALNLDLIIAQKFPDHGLGLAINDRLSRASTKRQ